MGRRKIAIAKITHERNRSVTFLKRKNGLFKKAYELGVLCSVDVCVVIFEEKTGHPIKLFEYCSGDSTSILDRRRHFDGEKDCKGPNDFANKKDDDDDDDDDIHVDPHPHPPPSLVSGLERKDSKVRFCESGEIWIFADDIFRFLACAYSPRPSYTISSFPPPPR
ncbi:SRF-like protein [Sistotremastrum niveocremeum HHB9708]|uniref:SRF-like protein n=1 Tax=Sistotremastrum niveocremeum HHB9708 TaxID=1314777 RepID=A0A164WCQ0_9AGAM|nr:SRF-like protein [Sistotremastrum niveocremeum HHB9708]